MNLIDRLISVVYPYRCPCCGRVQSSFCLCEICAEDIVQQTIPEKSCKHCGFERKYCDCKRYHYLFEGITAPYYNRGTAQDGVYSLKFGNAAYSAKYFGAKMAEKFKARFPKTNIDLVCIVPSTKGELSDKLYDKVELLAKSCAKDLKLPLNTSLLKKIKSNRKQHDLSHDERQSNVKGVYKATKRLDGKTVLLIDDIKTTGYTLNECAKQLRMAGAECVYCATALITLNKSCNNKETEI